MSNTTVFAQQSADAVAQLLQDLRDADKVKALRIERELKLEWSKSGSAAMDLLQKRGEDAMERGDLKAAIDHLSALIDHAPGFAEGYHLRAQAWLGLEQPGLALADLEQTLALNPNHFGAVFGLGVLLETLEQPQLAYRAYALVKDIHPHYQRAAEAMTRLEPLVQGRAL